MAKGVFRKRRRRIGGTLGHTEVQISAIIANSLITNAPLSEAQLEAAYRHYRALADLLAISGPKFGEAKDAAALLGNTALERLRKHRADQERARKAEQTDDGLEPIH